MNRRRFRRVRAWLLGPIVACVRLVGRLCTWRGAQRLGSWCGSFAWRISGVNRRRALAHLKVAFPELSKSECERLARDSFRHQVMNASELLHLISRGAEPLYDLVDVEGWEHVEAALESGRPLLLVTGHCGNWELLPTAFHRRGIPMAAVVRAAKDAALEELLTSLRATFGTRLIHRGEKESVRHLLGVLRGGTALILLVDQDFQTEGVWVPFFGRLAHTPVGAARLAIRRKAVAVPAFMERLEDGRHLSRFGPPLELPDDPAEATAVMTRAVEDQIRRVPAQWVWSHRRWRRRPPEEIGGHNTH